MGAHTGPQRAKAASLREHWFKEYLASSNTPGDIESNVIVATTGTWLGTCGHCVPRPQNGASEQFFLARQHLVDRRLHRMNSTLRGGLVNATG